MSLLSLGGRRKSRDMPPQERGALQPTFGHPLARIEAGNALQMCACSVSNVMLA